MGTLCGCRPARWDSKQTDWKAPNTPCGKNLMRPMVEAFRAQGQKPETRLMKRAADRHFDRDYDDDRNNKDYEFYCERSKIACHVLSP